MPFKIPRLESKTSWQRQCSSTQDSAYSSSQFDFQGSSFCSQSSRDSALGSSQPEKLESNGFWTSLRGFIETEKRSQPNNFLANSNSSLSNIVDDIWSTVMEIDALMTKFFVEPSALSETGLFHSKLEQALEGLKLCSANAKGLFTEADKMTSRITALRNALSKILSSSIAFTMPPTFHQSLCRENSTKLKLDCFASNLDFMVKVAQKRIESARLYSPCTKRPNAVICMSPRPHRLAPRGMLTNTSKTHRSDRNARRTCSAVPAFIDRAKTITQQNAPDRKTSEFSIKFCDKVVDAPTLKKIGLQFGSHCRPNVRWRQQPNLVSGYHTGVQDSPSLSPIFSDRSSSATQHLLLSLGSMGDTCDSTKECLDDDGFSSISDDCISLNALLEVEQ